MRALSFVLKPLMLAMALAACNPAAEPAPGEPADAPIGSAVIEDAAAGSAVDTPQVQSPTVETLTRQSPPPAQPDEPRRGGPGRGRPQTLAGIQARLAAGFDRLDADDDGVVTTAELEAGAAEGGRGGRQLARADANGDGRTTRDEVRAMAARMFSRMDADGDGTITPEERPQWGDGQRPN